MEFKNIIELCLPQTSTDYTKKLSLVYGKGVNNLFSKQNIFEIYKIDLRVFSNSKN